MAGMAGNDWKLVGIARSAWEWLECLYIAGNGWKWLEMVGYGGNGWK